MQPRLRVLPLALKADRAEGGVGVPVGLGRRFVPGRQAQPVVVLAVRPRGDALGAQRPPGVVIGGPEEGAVRAHHLFRRAEVVVDDEKEPARRQASHGTEAGRVEEPVNRLAAHHLLRDDIAVPEEPTIRGC